MLTDEEYKEKTFELLRSLTNEPPYINNHVIISKVAKNSPTLFKKFCIDFILDGNFDYKFDKTEDIIYRVPKVSIDFGVENRKRKLSSKVSEFCGDLGNNAIYVHGFKVETDIKAGDVLNVRLIFN